jgi:hypothetical protein
LQIAGGPRVRINDPEGIFAPKSTASPYFIADTENPSVSSFSGFPMCIPHAGNAETCKDSNRPAGQTTFDAPDPLSMVPFKVGDFIEYSGLRSSGEILASSVTAINVQVTTKASDTVPNYIRVEDMLVGVQDTAANVEVADVRVIGFLSSCAGDVVTISAIDVDPCTGAETYRRVGSATPRQETRCKWEARLNTVGLAPYTREYLITTNTPTVKTKNGIEAGQYVQAVGEWIFPEVDVPGTNPPPLIFSDIRGLFQGDFLDDQQFGPLSPFPGAAPPSPSKQCSAGDIPANNPTTPATPTTPTTGNPTTPNAPVTEPVAAAAQFAAVQRVGALLSLAGSNTAQGLNNDQLNFKWTQTSGTPAITLTNPNTPTASFTAPKVTTETSFVFELAVSLISDTTKTSKANVTVKVSPTAPDVVAIDTYTWESRQSGSIAVSSSSNVRDGSNKKMTLLINGVTNIPMAVSGGAGRWAYTARSTARPNTLQCVSDLSGKSAQRTGTQTTRRRRRGVLGV